MFKTGLASVPFFKMPSLFPSPFFHVIPDGYHKTKNKIRANLYSIHSAKPIALGFIDLHQHLMVLAFQREP